MSDAKMLAGIMGDFSNWGLALRSDFVKYINGEMSVDDLQAFHLRIFPSMLKRMKEFDIDGSIAELLSDLEEENEWRAFSPTHWG
jgi:hypothetical protein